MESAPRSPRRERIDEIIKYQNLLTQLKQKLVADCPHDHVKYWPDGSGSCYYDKAEYWYNIKCQDCLKHWIVPQENSELAKFKTAAQFKSASLTD